MLTLRALNAIDADRLHRKLGRAWRDSEERLAGRRYRMLCNGLPPPAQNDAAQPERGVTNQLATFRTGQMGDIDVFRVKKTA